MMSVLAATVHSVLIVVSVAGLGSDSFSEIRQSVASDKAVQEPSSNSMARHGTEQHRVVFSGAEKRSTARRTLLNDALHQSTSCHDVLRCASSHHIMLLFLSSSYSILPYHTAL